ncbi:hypothetical protein V3C99_014143 [Haemonchus contortus]
MFILSTILSIVFLYVTCEPCEEEWTFVPRVHSCYLAPHQPLTWHDAEEYCQRADANLVSINSAKESHYVRLLADQHNPQFLTWIGLSREENTTEALFRWSDGSELSFTSFREDEPSAFGNCVALPPSEDANGWVTIDCNYMQFFLCEKHAQGPEPIVLTSESGEFYSPRYPGNYENDVSVNYYVELSPEYRVLITIEQMETEQSHDYLLILDNTEDSRTLAMLSGSHYNRSFLSLSNAVTVIFSSDESGNGAGFKARYSAWKLKPVELLGEPGGVVQSEAYPDFAPPFTTQRFLIQCSAEQHVHLNVSDFECHSDDKLVFHDGPTIQDPVLQAPCGSLEPARLFRSQSDSVYVTFVTEDSLGLSRWRFGYDCVRKDGFGDEIVIL